MNPHQTEKNLCSILILLTILVVNGLRFFQIGKIPSGFYFDEVAEAVNVMCLKEARKFGSPQPSETTSSSELSGSSGRPENPGAIESHRDFKGNSWPLYSPTVSGGYSPPTFLYLGWIWSSLFGDSPTAFRSLIAFSHVLALLGLVLIGFFLLGGESSIWIGLAGSLSPWGFQLSRVAWGSTLGPLFLVLGLGLLIKIALRLSTDVNKKKKTGKKLPLWLPQPEALGAALSFVIAAYAYRATLLFLPIFLGLWFLFQKKIFPLPLHQWIWLGLGMSFFLLPLFLFPDKAAFNARFQMLSVFSDHPANPAAHANLFGQWVQIGRNFLLHLNPQFLFVSGDHNLRHSTGTAGIGSWMDLVVLILLGGMGVKNWWSLQKPDQRALTTIGKTENSPCETESMRTVWRKSLLILAALGFGVGLLPAALTWESLPHALRAFNGWPFWCLGIGVGAGWLSEIAWKQSINWGLGAFILLWGSGGLFISFYLSDYFSHYSDRSRIWFDGALHQAAITAPSSQELQRRLNQAKADPFQIAYYRMFLFQESCPRNSSHRAQ